MTTIFFNVTTFRALFSEFSNATTYPDAVLQLYWDTATAYISNQSGGCFVGALKIGPQTLALNQMTAHIAYLNSLAAAGEQGGVVTGATIDKISVQLEPPPSSNNWQFWLNQSPYGQALLALLKLKSVGGFYFGGFPTSIAFRR